MNSSKVSRRTAAFVPEKIVSRKTAADPTWQSLTFPRERKEDTPVPDRRPEPDGARRRPAPPEDFPLREEEATPPEVDSKMDFSAPDASATAPLEPDAFATDAPLLDEDRHQENIEAVREEAYAQGVRDGQLRAEEDFGSGIKALTSICEQLNTLRETILNNSMAEMQNLVLTIAEKIIRHSVTEQDRTVLDTVEEAIHLAVKSDEFIIQVNPDDLDVVKAKADAYIGAISGLEHIVVQANPDIERGGCRVDSSTSTVDATVASQLRIIEEKIKGKT